MARLASPRPRVRAIAAGASGAMAALMMAAPAMAGGGVVVQDGDLDVAVQHTVAAHSSGRVELLVDFTLDGAAQEDSGALLLIATPSEPTIEQASDSDLAAMAAADEVSAPAVVQVDQWWPDMEYFAGEETEVVEAPDSVGFDDGGVHSLGPAGADGVIDWLNRVGFPPDSDSRSPSAPTVTRAGTSPH